MAELPQELIDAILEDVPDSSLGACSMTSCAFVVSSQRRLFRSMSLPDYRIYARAARLLAESPHLAGYVRYLALNISFIPDDYTHLKSILARLSDIERVAIIGTPSALMMRQLSLVEFLARLSIKCLALDAIHDVGASFLSGAFKYLEEVVLSNISIAVEVDEEEPSALLSTLSIASQEVQNTTQSMGQLHSPADAAIRHLSIHVDHFGHTLSFVLDPARISLLQQLTRLSIIFPPVSEDLWIGFTALLRACARTLNHLELELETPPNPPLPVLPKLNELVLWLDAELAKTPDQLTAITAASVASTPRLLSLTLVIIDRPGGERRPPRHQWTGRRPWAWADLDSLLVDDLSLHLRTAHFSLRAFTREDGRYAAFAPWVSGNLPRAANAGLLLFSYGVALRHAMDRFADADAQVNQKT